MKYQKMTNFLDTTSDDKDLPRFFNKKWVEVYDQLRGNYNVNKEIRIKTSMLRSDLCDFSDAYIGVEGEILLLKVIMMLSKETEIFHLKNNSSFINCISKTDGVKIDNAEDVDVVMLMNNLLEYSKNYRKTTGSLRNYDRDEPSNPLSSNSWSKNYVLADMTTNVTPWGATFKIKDPKLYVPVITFSKENDTKLLEQLQTGFKKALKWNKYRSQMTIQPQNKT